MAVPAASNWQTDFCSRNLLAPAASARSLTMSQHSTRNGWQIFVLGPDHATFAGCHCSAGTPFCFPLLARARSPFGRNKFCYNVRSFSLQHSIPLVKIWLNEGSSKATGENSIRYAGVTMCSRLRDWTTCSSVSAESRDSRCPNEPRRLNWQPSVQRAGDAFSWQKCRLLIECDAPDLSLARENGSVPLSCPLVSLW